MGYDYSCIVNGNRGSCPGQTPHGIVRGPWPMVGPWKWKGQSMTTTAPSTDVINLLGEDADSLMSP